MPDLSRGHAAWHGSVRSFTTSALSGTCSIWEPDLSRVLGARQEELRPILLRRMKEDVEDLPEKEEVVVRVQLTKQQRRFYNGIYEKQARPADVCCSIADVRSSEREASDFAGSAHAFPLSGQFHSFVSDWSHGCEELTDFLQRAAPCREGCTWKGLLLRMPCSCSIWPWSRT